MVFTGSSPSPGARLVALFKHVIFGRSLSIIRNHLFLVSVFETVAQEYVCDSCGLADGACGDNVMVMVILDDVLVLVMTTVRSHQLMLSLNPQKLTKVHLATSLIFSTVRISIAATALITIFTKLTFFQAGGGYSIDIVFEVMQNELQELLRLHLKATVSTMKDDAPIQNEKAKVWQNDEDVHHHIMHHAPIILPDGG